MTHLHSRPQQSRIEMNLQSCHLHHFTHDFPTRSVAAHFSRDVLFFYFCVAVCRHLHPTSNLLYETDWFDRSGVQECPDSTAMCVVIVMILLCPHRLFNTVNSKWSRQQMVFYTIKAAKLVSSSSSSSFLHLVMLLLLSSLMVLFSSFHLLPSPVFRQEDLISFAFSKALFKWH